MHHMLTKQHDIAALISSRICHDLISPIGAISNGLELLALTGTSLSPELTLITESVNAANAKVRFLRIAFGDATSNTVISPTEITDILNDFYNGPCTNLIWAIKTPLERRDLRLLFLLLLCAEKLAQFGGAITVAQTGDTFKISITGKNLRSVGFLDFTANRFHPQYGPPLIQFNLAQAQLDQMKYRMNIARTENDLCISITP